MIKSCYKFIATAAAAILATTAAFAAEVNVPRTISTNTTWSKTNTYFLTGYTFVINDATLTIEPGTVIKGLDTSGASAAALIITRGAKIMAEGTAEDPIIFTSEYDMLNGNLGIDRTGLWGGLIILGKATINSRANGQPAGTPAEDQIEGLSVTGDEIAYATFGGTNDTDNSGVLKYVSIRHGGAVIGGDNEINGVSLGGVGSGTVLSHVEVFANKDDGFEFFGGTVNGDHLVSAFGNDDNFDMDQGYRGNLQFLFSIQGDVSSDRGDKGLEWDGATSPLDATPKGNVTIANYTAIGIGNSTQPNGSPGRDNTAVNIRDNVTAKLYNSVFVNFAKGLDIENDIGEVLPDIKHNVWWSHIAANNTAAGLDARSTGTTDIAGYYSTSANDNQIINPVLRGISYTSKSGGLDPRPADTSPLLTGSVQTLSGPGLVNVSYKGAFSATELWIKGWTNLDKAGYVATVFDTGTGTGDAADDVTVVNAVVRGSTSKPSNVSTRGFVGTGLQTLNAGFVITGSQTQSVLVRVAGPTLGAAPFNLPGTLAAAQLRLFKAGAAEPLAVSRVVTTQSVALSAELGGFPLTQAGDATIVATLLPGVYSVEVSGVDSGTGIAIVEVYELD